jgi:hypothetical protein
LGRGSSLTAVHEPAGILEAGSVAETIHGLGGPALERVLPGARADNYGFI